jgi:hypothetical protein
MPAERGALLVAAKRSLRFTAVLLVLSFGLPVYLLENKASAQAADPSVIGAWGAPFEMGVKGIHSSVLPGGKVLLFSYPFRSVGSDAYVWNPATGAMTNVSIGWNRDIFCSGHSFLPDGRLFVTGGHVHAGAYGLGVRNNDIYDPATGTFSPAPLLTEERWYPTNVELPNGRVLVFGGFKNTNTSTKAVTVDSYDPVANTITTLPSTANRALGNYPRLHLLPNGKIANTNVARTQLFDPAANTWTPSALTVNGGRGESGGSVLLPGSSRILSFGGPGDASGADASSEIIDFSAPSPAWRSTGPMNIGRVWLNPVLLPDGKVLAVGGGTGGAYTNPVLQSEMFDPATETWSLMAVQQAPRVYHSTAILLPDGRVLSAGHDNGSYQTKGEIYSPPYLFKGPRPTIGAAPSTVNYGGRFTVTTQDAASIARVALIRPGSVTHSLHQDQRYVDLSFTVTGGGTLDIAAPADSRQAPPGDYMLFLVSSSGVPSVAAWVKVATGSEPPPPAITGFTPTSGGVGTVVDVSGSRFSGASAVTFNNVAASQFTVVSDTRITATVPSGATTGRIRVTTAGGTATSSTDFTVTTPPPPAAPYRDAVMADQPVGYWRLAETTGNALDETSNAAGGRYNGGVTRGVPGALTNDANLAARFDGVDDYVSVPDNGPMDVGDTFTYELWFKRGATQGVTQRLLHKGTGPATLGFGVNNKVVLLPGGIGVATTASSATAVVDQAWHHLVATKNGADVHIYLDGVDVTAPGTNTTMTTSTNALNIGRATTSSAYTGADIDEVAIYPVALSSARVLAHYQAGRGG